MVLAFSFSQLQELMRMTVAKLIALLGNIILYRLGTEQLHSQAYNAWNTIHNEGAYNGLSLLEDYLHVCDGDIEKVDIQVLQKWYNTLFESIVLDRFPLFSPAPRSETRRAFRHGKVLHFYGEFPNCYVLFTNIQDMEQRFTRLERILQALEC